MKIGIYLTPLLGWITGRERAMIQLLRALAEIDHDNSYTLFVGEHHKHLFEIQQSNFATCVSSSPRWGSRRIWQLLFLYTSRQVRQLDVLHLAEYPMPLYERSRMIAHVYDISPLLFPEVMPWKARVFYGAALHWSVHHADRVVTLSHSAKHEIVERLRVAPGRVNVVHLGVDGQFAPIRDPARLEQVRQKYGLPDRFVLYVGTIEPRKNLVRLVRAFQDLVRAGQDIHLVIAGHRGWMNQEVFQLAAAPDTRDRVCIPGYIEQADLPALYSLATLFVFPSVYEGFGLPVLEAMACGVPVVSSRIPALVEVVGDAACLFDPANPAELAATMCTLLEDDGLRVEMRRRGLERARAFSWTNAARQMLSIYQEVYAGR